MDPFSIAGLGLSAASLSYQVFAGCIKGYQLLSEAKDMPKEHQYLRVRLEMEHHRLLDWSEVAGLVAADGKIDLSKNLRIKRHLLLDVLTAIRTTLDEFGKVNGRYKELRPLEDGDKPMEDKSPDSATVQVEASRFSRRFPRGSSRALNKALDFIDHAPQAPKRLRWVVFDKDNFMTLLKRLAELNDFLHGLMDDSQTRALQHTQHQTYMEILQLHNNIEDLKQLVRALSVSDTNIKRPGSTLDSVPAAAVIAPQTEEKQNLARLAQFKAFNTDIEGSVGQETLKATQLERRHLRMAYGTAASSGQGRVEAIYQPGRTAAKHVWIEWKYHEADPPSAGQGPDSRVVMRVQQLAALLGETNKPEEFRAPRCLGYFYDHEEMDDDDDDGGHVGSRFGFVFEKPSGVAPTAKIVSLLELIKSCRPNSGPSLTDRMALASKIANCVHYLHSVNWLHKGLRSQNILFFHGADPDHDVDGARIRIEQPYLSGFDYARPAQSGELTEQPPQSAISDIYRHPSVHGSGGPHEGGFKKSFDVYSLGLILTEIALWRPIDAIMGIRDLATAKPGVISRVRDRILDESTYLDAVRFATGDLYRDVVRACVAGGKELGLADLERELGTGAGGGGEGRGPKRAEADESSDVVGALLQAAFYDRVVKRLEELKA